MYKIFLSFKFLVHRLVNWLCVVCVALAVTVLLAVMAIMGGFQKQLLESYQSISSDLVISVNGVPGDPRRLVERVESVEHVEGAAYRFYTLGILASEGEIFVGGGGQVGSHGVRPYGIDPAQEARASDFRMHLDRVVEPSRRVADLDDPFDTRPFVGPDERPRPGAVVGEELFRNLSLRKGQLITINASGFVDPGEYDGGETDVAGRSYAFLVTGCFKSGMYEYDNHQIFVPVEVEHDWLGASGGAGEIFVRLDDYENAPEARRDLLDVLPGGTPINTWEERNRTFIVAVQTEKMIQAIILSFMILLAGGSILSVLSMTVVEKVRDVGLVKAIGGSVSGILGVFVLNGFVIGVVGAAAGLALGIFFIEYINAIDAHIVAPLLGQRIFRPDVYVFDEIPTAYDPVSMATVIGITLAVSFLASLIPAWKAARVRPVEALRYE